MRNVSSTGLLSIPTLAVGGATGFTASRVNEGQHEGPAMGTSLGLLAVGAIANGFDSTRFGPAATLLGVGGVIGAAAGSKSLWA